MERQGQLRLRLKERTRRKGNDDCAKHISCLLYDSERGIYAILFTYEGFMSHKARLIEKDDRNYHKNPRKICLYNYQLNP